MVGSTVTVYLDDPDFTLYCGDAIETLRTLPDRSVQMCVTSPPFFGLRDYGVEGQIGLEDTPEQWCANLVAVFAEVRRVLRDDGTLWVEVGDSYNSGTTGQRPSSSANHGHWQKGGTMGDSRINCPSVKIKDLIGAPWMLAKALRDPYYSGTITRVEDRIWLAAMVDTEGSIGIHRRPAGQSAYSSFEKKDGTTSNYVRTQDSFQPKVEISNTSLPLIERVIELTGEGNSKVKQEAGTFGRKQTIYRWTLTADKARAFLREIYPHLVAKQHEARLAYGCQSSGDKAAAAHEALKLIHGGSTTGIDFPAPESMYERGWFLRSDIIWARLSPEPDARVRHRPANQESQLRVPVREVGTVLLRRLSDC